MRLVQDNDRQATPWRGEAATQLRHVATALEFEQLPNLSAYAVSSVQDVITQLRRAADTLLAPPPEGAMQ